MTCECPAPREFEPGVCHHCGHALSVAPLWSPSTWETALAIAGVLLGRRAGISRPRIKKEN